MIKCLLLEVAYKLCFRGLTAYKVEPTAHKTKKSVNQFKFIKVTSQKSLVFRLTWSKKLVFFRKYFYNWMNENNLQLYISSLSSRENNTKTRLFFYFSEPANSLCDTFLTKLNRNICLHIYMKSVTKTYTWKKIQWLMINEKQNSHWE